MIAVSGGADSCALALGIADLVNRKKLQNRYYLAHFNHALRGEQSDEDERFVRKLAGSLDFEFLHETALSEEIDQRRNTEEAARKARYRFLTRKTEELDCRGILTAHTINDQAETFLLNLIRGSGIEGLSGMKTVRQIDVGPASRLLIRPLLSWAKRDDTEQFSNLHSVSYRIDEMNEDERFGRVRVRKTLLPALKEFNPNIVETLARTANLLAQSANALESYEKDEFAAVIGKDEIEINLIKRLNAESSLRLLRTWLKAVRGDLRRLDSRHITAIRSLALSTKSGREVQLPGNEAVIKQNGCLTFRVIKVEK